MIQEREIATQEHVMHIETYGQAHEIVNRLAPLVQKVSLYGFDLDGTIVGHGIDFPQTGLRSLRHAGVALSIVSGAGARSITKKLEAATGDKEIMVKEYFTAPIVANEGAHLFNVTTDLRTITPADVIHETALSERGLAQTANLIKSLATDVDTIGFYPSVARHDPQSRHNPFSYLFYTPNLTPDGILRHYHNQTYVGTDIDHYAELLETFGASKVVIKASKDAALCILEQTTHIDGLRGTYNEGYINIVAPGTDKLSGLRKSASLQGMDDLKQLAFWGNDMNDREVLTGVPLGFVVNSNQEITTPLIHQIQKDKQDGHTIVVHPRCIDETLQALAEVRKK